MNIKKLNEEIRKMLSPVNEDFRQNLEDAIEGSYSEDELANFVMPNIDKISVAQLTDILDNSSMNDHTLFPSGYDYETWGPYPVKLAKALAESRHAEGIGDVYSVLYYNRRDKQAYASAVKLWQRQVLAEPETYLSIYEPTSDNDGEYDALATLMAQLSKEAPVFVKQLDALLKKRYDYDYTQHDMEHGLDTDY